MRAPARHASRALRDRRRQPGRAEILYRDNRIRVREVHARLEEAFLEEWVADLDGRAALGARLVELDRCERRAVDAVASGVGADQHEAVPRALSSRPHQPIDPHEPDAHRVDQRVLLVTLVEIDFAANSRDADAVAVAADACHDPLEVAARGRQWTESQRVEQSDRPSSHRDDVPDDSADSGRRTLIGLDGRWVIVRLDLEHGRPALADLDCAGVLTGALQHIGSAGRQPAQQGLRGLVRAVLGPQQPEHPELHRVRRPPEPLDDDAVLLRREGNLPQPALVYRVQTQLTSILNALPATDWKSLSPSALPSSASAQRSGWGIIPSTLPRLLMMPAMLCSEPFGLALGTTRPSASQ